MDDRGNKMTVRFGIEVNLALNKFANFVPRLFRGLQAWDRMCHVFLVSINIDLTFT